MKEIFNTAFAWTFGIIAGVGLGVLFALILIALVASLFGIDGSPPDPRWRKDRTDRDGKGGAS